MEFLRSVDLNEVDNLKEDEALAILSAKLTLNGLSVLKLAMSHVPCTYTIRCMEFQCFPLRTVLIHQIFTACCSSCSRDSLANVHQYVSFLEKYCTAFISSPEVLPHDKLCANCHNYCSFIFICNFYVTPYKLKFHHITVLTTFGLPLKSKRMKRVLTRVYLKKIDWLL